MRFLPNKPKCHCIFTAAVICSILYTGVTMHFTNIIPEQLYNNDDEFILEGLQQKHLTQYPRICKKRNSGKEDQHSGDSEKTLPMTWIMFMGDSNMRHTYHWWTTKGRQKNGVEGSTYGLDRTNLGFSGRWADQEILFPVPEGGKNGDSRKVSRYSFRFLHGSLEEFVHDATYWDIARKAVTKTEEVQQQGKIHNGENHGTAAAKGDDKNDSMWEGRIRPSDLTLGATKHQHSIDDNSKEFISMMKKWEIKTSPDVVILTQGWGGVPRSNEIDVVRTIVKNNPETLFIWSPLYVTDHSKDRYDSYVESGVFSWSEPNLRMVDLWHMAMTLPLSTTLYHAPVGGKYMQEAMATIWKEVSICTTGVDTENGESKAASSGAKIGGKLGNVLNTNDKTKTKLEKTGAKVGVARTKRYSEHRKHVQNVNP